MTISSKHRLYALWMILIAGFAVLHALNLKADFPNHSPWMFDWAKYTDEGWYTNAAVRAHLLGHWYQRGDFNPAVAVPLWPFLEWVVFFFTGVTIQAARGLAVGCFFLSLVLSYSLLRANHRNHPRWVPLLALTLIVTSPFLYCFSRLAILEPLLTTLTLAALNLAIRLPRMRHQTWAAAGVGFMFTLMVLTKTNAAFLLPAVAWAILLPLWHRRTVAVRCALAAACASFFSLAAWMALVAAMGLLRDYKYYFFINKYSKPPEFYWPLLSFWWSANGLLWIDRILVPFAVLAAVAALLARRTAWGRKLLHDPVFGASVWVVAGLVLFMTYQNHPQPRYYALAAFFCFILVALAAGALLDSAAPAAALWPRRIGLAAAGLAVAAAGINGIWTLNYARHPEFTFVNAAQNLTRYIDEHPNGKRLLVSISSDQITLVTHLPTLCDDLGTQDLSGKLAAYQPGWFATWNDLDPGTLEDIHNDFWLEQVAAFRAFDHPERNTLVLFKLHPLPAGQIPDPGLQNLQVPLADDKIDIPVE